MDVYNSFSSLGVIDIEGPDERLDVGTSNCSRTNVRAYRVLIHLYSFPP